MLSARDKVALLVPHLPLDGVRARNAPQNLPCSKTVLSSRSPKTFKEGRGGTKRTNFGFGAATGVGRTRRGALERLLLPPTISIELCDDVCTTHY